MIRCCRCGRRITKNAAPPQPGGVTEAYGPTCARLLGLTAPADLLRRRRARVAKPKPPSPQIEMNYADAATA